MDSITESKVRHIIADSLGIDDGEVTLASNLMHDFVDSLDVIEISCNLEEVFDIDIPDEDVRKWHTVKDVVDYIESRGSKAVMIILEYNGCPSWRVVKEGNETFLHCPTTSIRIPITLGSLPPGAEFVFVRKTPTGTDTAREALLMDDVTI